MHNIPDDVANDPNAPWNEPEQEEPDYTDFDYREE